MKLLVEGLRLIVTRKDSRWVMIISTLFFIVVLLIVQNGKGAFEMLGLSSLSLGKRVMLFSSVLFDLKSTFTNGALVLAALGSLVGGVNLALAYTYIKTRGEMILKSGLYSGTGLVLAFFGIGCAACGTAVLSVLLGFFGFSAILNVLPYQGLEIGYIGLTVLCFATYVLAKKVSAPNVC